MPKFVVRNGIPKLPYDPSTIEEWSNVCTKCGHDELEVRQRGVWITDSCPGHAWWHVCSLPDRLVNNKEHCHVKCLSCGHKATTFRKETPRPVKPPPIK